MRIAMLTVLLVSSVACSTYSVARTPVKSIYQPKPPDPTPEQIAESDATDARILRNRELNESEKKKEKKGFIKNMFTPKD